MLDDEDAASDLDEAEDSDCDSSTDADPSEDHTPRTGASKATGCTYAPDCQCSLCASAQHDLPYMLLSLVDLLVLMPVFSCNLSKFGPC